MIVETLKLQASACLHDLAEDGLAETVETTTADVTASDAGITTSVMGTHHL
jgi:hypothetical protein